MIIDLNCLVQVTLTELGQKQWAQHAAKTNNHLRGAVLVCCLCELMQVFGGDEDITFSGSLFVDDQIILPIVQESIPIDKTMLTPEAWEQYLKRQGVVKDVIAQNVTQYHDTQKQYRPVVMQEIDEKTNESLDKPHPTIRKGGEHTKPTGERPAPPSAPPRPLSL